MIESLQPSRDSEEPLHYGQMRQETLGAKRVISADEVERRGIDITDLITGQHLKKEGGLRGSGLRPGEHLVALVRDNNIVTATDITDVQERSQFYDDMNIDERDGKLTGSANYRVFRLSDEDFAACANNLRQ